MYIIKLLMMALTIWNFASGAKKYVVLIFSSLLNSNVAYFLEVLLCDAYKTIPCINHF